MNLYSRCMRAIVFFDLPTVSPEDLRAYRRFRRDLIKNGFCMMQESVYAKLLLNMSAFTNTINTIRRICPENGVVQVLCITEKQYAKIEFMAGKKASDIIDSPDGVIFL